MTEQLAGTVLFVQNGLGAGGAERSLAELLPGLVDEGIRPIVVCLYRRPEGIEHEVVASGIDVRFLSARRLVPRALEIRRIIARERPDLIHTTIFEANLAGRLASARMGLPVLSSLVNTPYIPVRLGDPNVSRVGMGVAHVADAWTARHLTDHFHALTHAVKSWAVKSLRLNPELITVVERGRDPRRLGERSPERRAVARRALGISEDARVILSVGRQEFQKGQEHLLEAMPRILAREPNATLLVAGRTGNASPGLQRQLRDLGEAASAIRFLGHREDVPELLAAADLFAFPSLFEGLGGALIEAMALGLPIVASEVPAIREVVEDGRSARVVPAASPDALASAVGDLLVDRPTARAYGDRGREIFLERFTLERSTSALVALYRRLMRRSATVRSAA